MIRIPPMTDYRRRRTDPTTARDERTCVLCRRHPANVVLLPCRHLAVCTPCLQDIHACPRGALDVSATLGDVGKNSRTRVAALTGVLLQGYVNKGGALSIQGTEGSSKWDFARRFHGIFHSHLTTVTVLPATPVFGDTVPHSPGLGCVFPGMRFEDLRLSSFFNSDTIPVGQPVPSLASSGYYHDVIFQNTRCFCCGQSFGQGHSQDCGGRRAQCNIPLNQCSLHRQQHIEQNIDLHMIVNSPGFILRDENVRRGAVRDRQSRSRFRLPPMRQYTRRTSIRESRTCLLCRSSPAVVLLQPCLHLVLCTPCSRRSQTCPRCDANIEETVETLP
ncbi:hypothetical protein C0Q70_11013 [Pomacea canaliculata]|uniref:RING-type domain-containing protein n=1 Tax=Pomacea canaliculata TaxID=400727 RepID=A0A2T7P4T8_POMCA|nr:hypothetical protein C0Q70_11013 [Pomacea canaliculata]